MNTNANHLFLETNTKIFDGKIYLNFNTKSNEMHHSLVVPEDKTLQLQYGYTKCEIRKSCHLHQPFHQLTEWVRAPENYSVTTCKEKLQQPWPKLQRMFPRSPVRTKRLRWGIVQRSSRRYLLQSQPCCVGVQHAARAKSCAYNSAMHPLHYLFIAMIYKAPISPAAACSL